MDTDEFDSLATLHGILCAFLLSISIGVQISLSAENTGYITFCAALAKQQGFVHWSILISTRQNWNTIGIFW